MLGKQIFAQINTLLKRQTFLAGAQTDSKQRREAVNETVLILRDLNEWRLINHRCAITFLNFLKMVIYTQLSRR